MVSQLDQQRSAVDVSDVDLARNLIHHQPQENLSAELFPLASQVTVTEQQRKHFSQQAAELDDLDVYEQQAAHELVRQFDRTTSAPAATVVPATYAHAPGVHYIQSFPPTISPIPAPITPSVTVTQHNRLGRAILGAVGGALIGIILRAFVVYLEGSIAVWVVDVSTLSIGIFAAGGSLIMSKNAAR